MTETKPEASGSERPALGKAFGSSRLTSRDRFVLVTVGRMDQVSPGSLRLERVSNRVTGRLEGQVSVTAAGRSDVRKHAHVHPLPIPSTAGGPQ